MCITGYAVPSCVHLSKPASVCQASMSRARLLLYAVMNWNFVPHGKESRKAMLDTWPSATKPNNKAVGSLMDTTRNSPSVPTTAVYFISQVPAPNKHCLQNPLLSSCAAKRSTRSQALRVKWLLSCLLTCAMQLVELCMKQTKVKHAFIIASPQCSKVENYGLEFIGRLNHIIVSNTRRELICFCSLSFRQPKREEHK